MRNTEPAHRQEPHREEHGERADARTRLRDAMRRAMNTLSPNLRTVLVLRELERLSTRETAGVLETSSGTVKTRLYRARKELCQLFWQQFRPPAMPRERGRSGRRRAELVVPVRQKIGFREHSSAENPSLSTSGMVDAAIPPRNP